MLKSLCRDCQAIADGLCRRCMVVRLFERVLEEPSDQGTTDPPTANYVPASDEVPPDQPGHESLTLTMEAENMVGDYELLEEIARGGMGVVRRCRDHVLQRDLAMKVLREDHRDDVRFLRHFQREARVMAELQHPGIVPIHKVGTLPDGPPFFVMKLVKGHTLDQLLGEKGPGAARWLGVFASICQAVAYAHSQGVIHCDLKPRNVMVGAFGEVHVMDWGLAKLLRRRSILGGVEPTAVRPSLSERREDTTQTYDVNQSLMGGTFPYMPPEVARGLVGEMDRRSDVFGLGAILCEILTGKPPYAGPRPVELQAREANLEDARARLEACGADPELIALAKRCLAVEKDERPQDADEVAKAVAAYLADVENRARKAEVEREVERQLRQFAEGKAEDERQLRQFAEENEKQAKDMAEGERRERKLVEEKAEVESRARRRMRRLTVGLAASFGLFLLALLAVYYINERAEKLHLADTIDKALTAAMGGDLEAAEQAIAEAELAGASPGQVRMLRGQIALHRGQTQKALEHLEQAVRLLPESVAARGMLAAAHGYDGQWERYEKTIQEMEKLSPSTAEDYLFKGYAEANLDPEKGLESITKAFVLRPNMRIARLLRAEVRAYRAQDTDDLKQAEGAVEDAVFAKGLLVDNPAALWGRLNAHLYKAGVHEHRGEPAERRAELKLAEKDALALERFTELPDAVVYRWLYFREVDREEEVLEELRLASERTDHVYVAFCYALTLYRRGKPGDFEEALRVLRDKKRHRSYNDRLLPFVLAEHDWPGKNNLPGKHDWPARARKASDDFAQRSQDGLALMNAQTVLCLLGKKEAAVMASKALQKQPERFYTLRRPPILRCVDYNAGDLPADQLVQKAQGSQWDQCLAHFFIAMMKLAEGDRDGAREHFDKVVKTRAFIWGAYDLSWVYLARLEKDPNWPPWIEAKRAK